MGATYAKATDLPQVLPVFPLDGALLLPRGQLPLNVFEPRYLNLVDDVMAGERMMGIVQTRGGERARPELAQVGCAGRVTSFAETSDGRYLITLSGVCRFRTGPELSSPTPYRQVRADYAAFERDLSEAADADVDKAPLLDALATYLKRRGLSVDWQAAEAAPAEALINSLSMALPFEAMEKEALLQAYGVVERLDTLVALLRIDAAADDDDTPSVQ